MIRATLAIGAATAATMALAACGSSTSKDSKVLAVTLTDTGCTPQHVSVAAGPVTFKITNGGTSKVSEMELKNGAGVILGESENVVEGVPGSFSLNLEAGQYVVSCPTGDAEDQGTLTVAGKPSGKAHAASTALLERATDAYERYVTREVAQLRAGVARFADALERGELERAKDLYGPVRAHYETIEPVAESFGDLDPAIDARINDVEKPSEWSGFHRLEKTLWEQDTTRGTAPYARQLVRDVDTLQRKLTGLQLQPAQLANGAVELMNEVASSKITGEEDRYSHTDLSDFQGNLDGSHEAFKLLVPALSQTGNAALARTIEARFADVQRGLDAYRRNTPLGFALYSEVSAKDRQAFAALLDALDEPLSQVAAKVSGA
jgi:iron uptake system component EfeO